MREDKNRKSWYMQMLIVARDITSLVLAYHKRQKLDSLVERAEYLKLLLICLVIVCGYICVLVVFLTRIF